MSFTLLIIQIVIYLVAFFIFRATHINSGIVISITIVTLVINSLVFRFQRTTLGIARAMGLSDIFNIGDIQSFLTPETVTIVHWLNTVISAITFTLLGINVNWLISIAFLLFMFIGTGVIDVFLPIPSHKFCIEMIKKHLDTQRRSQKSIETLTLTVKVLGMIDEVKVF